MGTRGSLWVAVIGAAVGLCTGGCGRVTSDSPSQPSGGTAGSTVTGGSGGSGGASANGGSGGTAAIGGFEPGCATQVAVAFDKVCARRSDGTAWCWAASYGDGTPVQVSSLGANVAELYGGGVFALITYYENVCARTADGKLWCWGDNESGQIGDGTFDDPKLSPVEVVALGSDVIDVGVGGKHTCAVKADGTLWCWGLYLGTNDDQPLPVQITALGSAVAQVDASSNDTCAVKTDGTLWCSGLGAPAPVQVLALGSDVAAVAAGACALKNDGALWCWDSAKYSHVKALGNSVTRVASTCCQTCAIRTDGSLWCWPHLGEPAEVSAVGAVAGVALGLQSICVVTTSGAVACAHLPGYGKPGHFDQIAMPCP